MNRTVFSAAVVAVAAALAPMTLSNAANAAPTTKVAKPVTASELPIVNVRWCRRRFGPYATQRRAYEVRRIAIARGYRVSGVWGSGGFYARMTRGYYFNVFYRC